MLENQRFKGVFVYLREHKYVRNQQDFTERIGSDKSTVSQIMNERISIPNHLFACVAEAFPFIDGEWIRTGNGAMLKLNNGENARDVIAEIRNGLVRMVPLINIDSVGGIHSENLISPEEQYVIKTIPFTEARPGDVAILQTGTSMYPTIPSGSALLIRAVEGWREYFGYGSIYVLLLTDGRRITKEIKRYDPDPKNYVLCHSYNPEVADEELPKSMIQEVWKVVKYIADFGW